MSRGRSRHQASRRRMYSARQRDLRERRQLQERQHQYWLSDGVTAVEIEESLDFEAPTSWSIRLPERGRAA
jgi:hypothetical protein